jgi:hypothetical protein
VTSFFSSSFYGVFRRRLVLRGWGGGLLRRDNLDKRKRKKETYPPAGTSLQVQTDRRNSPCKEIPAGVGSSELFTQRDDLCGQLHVVYPGRYSCGSVSAVFTCGE